MKTLNRTNDARPRGAAEDAARVPLSGGPEAAISAPHGAETIARAIRRLTGRSAR
jgi:hypothetical protein